MQALRSVVNLVFPILYVHIRNKEMTHCRSHCWAIYGIYHISSFKPAFLSVVDFVVFMLMETYVDVIFDVYADGAYVVVVSVGLCICLLSIPQVNVDVPAQAICAV